MLDQVLAHLQSEATGLAGFEIVESVEMLAEMTQRNDGAGFVVPFRERAQANQRASGGHLQPVAEQIVVAFITRNYSDDGGASRVSLFQSRKASIETALAGWTPASDIEPFELVGGESTYLREGVSLYAQTWETSRFLTGDPS